MDYRQQMLNAIRGQPTEAVPWAPRMDLWYIALRARDQVPDRFEGMNTAQIADELGVACHAVRADYTLPRPPEDLSLRALGIDNHPDHAFRVELRDLPIDFKYEDGRYSTTIRTPAGTVDMRLTMTRKMAAEGISLPFVEKYPIAGPEDFEAVAQVFEHLEVIPTPQNYAKFHDRIGRRGLAVACGPLGASPIHLLLHDVMAMEEFFILFADAREQVIELAARMEPYYDAMLDALLQCSAEAVFWGANYDRDTTWPPFFKEHVAPWLTKVSGALHDADKLLLTHTDGENHELMPMYPACGFDIGESVCPAPMTSCTLADIRQGFGPAATAWGGIPCVVLLDDTCDQGEFEAHMDKTFADLGSGERLILGVSDNVPPDVNLDRLEQVKQWIDAFGPVTPA